MTAFVAVTMSGVNSLAASNARDCDNNAIIKCGALTQAELLSKFDANATGDLPPVFANYGIARSDMAGTTSQVKLGKVYRDGRVEVDGQIVATNAMSVGRQNISGSQAVSIAGKTYYQRPASVSFRSDIDAFVLMRNGQFYAAVLSSCANPVVATPVAQPKYTCDALNVTKISRNEYSFAADATASGGAAITGYTFDFGDGQTAFSANRTVSHTYQKAGSYSVKVSVSVSVNGKPQLATGPNCQKVFVVEAQLTPLYSCDGLSARVISLKDRQYEYTLAYTAKNGATLQSATYDFGDSQKITLSGNDSQTVSHAYSLAGSFKTIATLAFSVTENNQSTIKSVKCEVAISTSPEMCALNPTLSKNDARCQPCPLPGKEYLPKDSPLCVTPAVSVMPAELPKTGLGDLISGGLGLGSLTAAGYYWQGSRRLLGKFKNR